MMKIRKILFSIIFISLLTATNIFGQSIHSVLFEKKEETPEVLVPFYLRQASSLEEFKVEGNGVLFEFSPAFNMPHNIHNPWALDISGGQNIWLGKKIYINTQQHLSLGIPKRSENIESELFWNFKMRSRLNLMSQRLKFAFGPFFEIGGKYEELNNYAEFTLGQQVHENPIDFKGAGFSLEVEGRHVSLGVDFEYANAPNGDALKYLKFSRMLANSTVLFGKNWLMLLSYDRRFAAYEQFNSDRAGLGFGYAGKKWSVNVNFSKENIYNHVHFRNYYYGAAFTRSFGHFYLGSKIELQSLNKNFNVLPSIFLGLNYSDGKKSHTPNLSLKQEDKIYPYSILVPVNDAYLAISRNILPFHKNSVDLSLYLKSPNRDERDSARYFRDEERTLENNVIGEFLSANYFLPIPWTGFGLNAYYQNIESKSGEKEHRFMLEPYGVIRGKGIAGIVGFPLYPGYPGMWGTSLGVSTLFGDVSVGFKFDHRKIRVVNFGLDLHTSDRAAFSLYTEFDRKNSGQGLMQFGLDIRLTDNFSLISSVLWSSNSRIWNDAFNDMTSRDKFSFSLGAKQWLSPDFFWSPAIGIAEAKDEYRTNGTPDVFNTAVFAKIKFGFLKNFLKLKQNLNSKKGFPYYKYRSHELPLNGVNEYVWMLKGNFVEYNLATARHFWDDAFYEQQYRTVYLEKRGGYDFIRHNGRLGILKNLVKNFAIGFAVDYTEWKLLNEKRRTLDIVFPKFVWRFAKGEATLGFGITYDGERLKRPVGWNGFWGISLSSVQLAGGVKFGQHGDVTNTWLLLNFWPYPGGVISLYGNGYTPHGQESMASITVRLVRTRLIDISLHSTIEVGHSEESLDKYYPLSNNPQRLMEWVHYSYEAGLTFIVGNLFYCSASYFQEHWMSPSGPFLKGFKFKAGVSYDLKKFGI